MKIIQGLELRQITPESFVLEDSGTGILSNKMITFNSTAAYLWNSIGNRDFSLEDIIELLVNEYSIPKEIAEEDSKTILRAWTQASIVEC